jgi:hypothetical protein
MCRPLPANPSISTSSAAWSALNFQSGRDNLGGMLIANVSDPFADPNDGSEPVEELPVGAPTIAQVINCGAVGWGVTMCGRFGSQGKTWNVPADMMPAGNTDHHFSYEDEGAGGEYDFWLAQPPGTPGSTMTVGGAGFCRWGTDGTNCSDSTATNIATSIGGIDAGLLQAAESSPSGTLPYAIASAALCADPSYVYPASSSDGANTNSSSACAGATAAGQRPPEGTRWFLNMTDAQVNATNNAPYVKAILRTLDSQHYGGVVTDTNWSGAPGLTLNYHRGNFSFAAAEAGLTYGANNTIPFTNNGFDPATAIVFCTNGTC